MKNLLFLVVVFLTIGCTKDNAFSTYQGTWSGTFSGDLTGTWRATINEVGKLSGSAEPDSAAGFVYTISGTISTSGQINATSSVFGQTIQFDGTANSTTLTGGWINAQGGLQGTWIGTKQ